VSSISIEQILKEGVELYKYFQTVGDESRDHVWFGRADGLLYLMQRLNIEKEFRRRLKVEEVEGHDH
jgi:hypothetical protein